MDYPEPERSHTHKHTSTTEIWITWAHRIKLRFIFASAISLFVWLELCILRKIFRRRSRRKHTRPDSVKPHSKLSRKVIEIALCLIQIYRFAIIYSERIFIVYRGYLFWSGLQTWVVVLRVLYWSSGFFVCFAVNYRLQSNQSKDSYHLSVSLLAYNMNL